MANISVQLTDGTDNMYPQLGYAQLATARESKSVTANSWFKLDLTFTLTQTTLVVIQAVFLSGGPLGVGVSTSTAASISSVNDKTEQTTASSMKLVTTLGAGTYSVWGKCSGTTWNNTVNVYKLCDLG